MRGRFSETGKEIAPTTNAHSTESQLRSALENIKDMLGEMLAEGYDKSRLSYVYKSYQAAEAALAVADKHALDNPLRCAANAGSQEPNITRGAFIESGDYAVLDTNNTTSISIA